MKSGIILKSVVALGIVGSLYSVPQRTFTAQAQAPSSTNDATASLQEQIVAKEREGLDALKTGNLDIFAKSTADEAIMVDAQGPATKAQVLKNVGEFKLTDYSIDDLKFVPVSATTGLITYKITESGVSHGHEFTAKAYVSSLWTKRAGRWLCLFSQETGTK